MPENNIIAKKFKITLDTIKQKLIRTDFIAIIGDSIEITVNLIENANPKDITNSNVILLGVRSDGSYFEQRENIIVSDGVNGVIKIYPKLDIFSVEGQTICGLIVQDEDETINIQRFSVNVSKSIATDIIVEAKNEIQTLKELNELLDEYRTDLSNINQSVSDMESLVVEKTNKVSKDFELLSNGIETEIEKLQNDINGVNETVNYKLTKRIKLEPYRLEGSNFIYFKFNVNKVAKELLKCQYQVAMGGSVDTGTYNASISLLNFYSSNSKVYPFIVNISDRTVNGKNLNASVVYSNLGNDANINDNVDLIYIKSNILKSLNTDDGIYCYLTPLTD